MDGRKYYCDYLCDIYDYNFAVLYSCAYFYYHHNHYCDYLCDIYDYNLAVHHYGGEPVPYCFWFFGGHSRERYNAAPGYTPIAKLSYLPPNHQSNFAPDPEPTLRGGVSALTSAALAYLPATGVQKDMITQNLSTG